MYRKYSQARVVSEQRMKRKMRCQQFHFARHTLLIISPRLRLSSPASRGRAEDAMAPFVFYKALCPANCAPERLGVKTKRKHIKKKEEFMVYSAIPSVTALLTGYITGLVCRFAGPRGASPPSYWLCSFKRKHRSRQVSEVWNDLKKKKNFYILCNKWLE